MKLAELIHNKEMAVTKVARRIGVTTATIYNWGEDNSNIDAKAHLKLVELLGEDYIRWFNKKRKP